MKIIAPKLSEMLGLPACLTDAERGAAIAVYNHNGESAALHSAHNMIGKRLDILAENIRKLTEALKTYNDNFRECSYCAGKGIEPNTYEDACEVCGGYGFNPGGDIRQSRIDASALLAELKAVQS